MTNKKNFFSFIDVSLIHIVPQPIQHKVIADYVEHVNGKIGFYSGESIETARSRQVLNAKVQEKPPVDGFVFLTIKQFISDGKIDFALIKKMLSAGYEVHFAFEQIYLHSLEDLNSNFERLYVISKTIVDRKKDEYFNDVIKYALHENNDTVLDERSKYLRRLTFMGLEGGKRGHIGSTLSLIEIFRVLYDDILIYEPSNPNWQERDRCILSKGHGCLALYAILADKGFFSTEELKRFCHLDGLLGGHPEVQIPGVEASTGALGHGLGIGVGVAIAMQMKKSKSRVFVIMGDGEINEGSVWESAMSAAKHQLSNLTVLIDYNKIQSYSFNKEVLNLEPLADKWKSFGFSVDEVDGHNIEQLHSSLTRIPFNNNKPSVVICHTIKGKGLPSAEGNPSWHHKSSLTSEQIQEMFVALEAYE